MRTMRGSMLFCATLLAASCATAPAPEPAPAPITTPPPPGSRADVEQFRRDFQDVYAQIVAHEQKPAGAPAVDVEAAKSIPIPQHRSIPAAVSLFSNELRSDIQTYLNRSARYRKLIEKSLAEVDLPKGLAYLPVIESGYTPTMTSRSGAHGIWQFMPDTAREYGLRVDWWVDERADPERSTKAAAQYLKDLYREFNDWSLTLAAYNAGPGRIRRALAENNTSSFWDLVDGGALSKETRGYVPTFFATLIIASDPQSYGFKLAPPADVDAKHVDVDGPVSLRYLASVAGVDEETMRDLNPEFRRGMLPPGRSSVRVPAKSAEAIASRATTLKNADETLQICSFTLREGDSLRRLARALGTDVDTILAMNGLSSSKRVGEGDSLFLPVRARDLGSLLAHADDDVLYAVKRGDTLYSIAKKHGISVEELCDLNDLSRHDKLHAGQKLRVSAPRALAAGGGM
jgi:membrane-bound lytic murein transglycosylase D